MLKPASIRPASIRDVAREAGVSISTVSRALRGYSDVNAGTRARVEETARNLGYTPDAAGQALKSGRTGTVAVLVSGRHGPALLDAFYAEVLGLEAHFSAHDLSLLLLRAGSGNAERLLLQSGRCDGVIALGCDLPAAFLQALQARSVPLVLTDSESFSESVPSVTVANEAGGYDAARHLLGNGRQRLAFVAETPDDPNFSLRRQGFLRAHADSGLTVPAERLQAGTLGPAGGYLATKKLLERADFDAIFAANDTAAFGAIRALGEVGRRVPEDVALVGFDDIALARYSQPPLTTLQVPRQAMGRQAATCLTGLLSGQTPSDLELPVSLVVRDLSGA